MYGNGKWTVDRPRLNIRPVHLDYRNTVHNQQNDNDYDDDDDAEDVDDGDDDDL